MFKMLTTVCLVLAIGAAPAFAASSKRAKSSASSAQQSNPQRPPGTPLPASQRPWTQTCTWDNPCESRNLY